MADPTQGTPYPRECGIEFGFDWIEFEFGIGLARECPHDMMDVGWTHEICAGHSHRKLGERLSVRLQLGGGWPSALVADEVVRFMAVEHMKFVASLTGTIGGPTPAPDRRQK